MQTRGDMCQALRVVVLKLGIASTMVAVKVRVNNVLQGTTCQRCFYECKCLFRMRGIAGIHDAGCALSQKHNIVRGQPATFKHHHVWRQRVAHYLPALSSRRKILPTLDLGNSSLNSMYLGCL